MDLSFSLGYKLLLFSCCPSFFVFAQQQLLLLETSADFYPVVVSYSVLTFAQPPLLYHNAVAEASNATASTTAAAAAAASVLLLLCLLLLVSFACVAAATLTLSCTCSDVVRLSLCSANSVRGFLHKTTMIFVLEVAFHGQHRQVSVESVQDVYFSAVFVLSLFYLCTVSQTLPLFCSQTLPLLCNLSGVLAYILFFLACVLMAVGLAWPNHLAVFAMCISVS